MWKKANMNGRRGSVATTLLVIVVVVLLIGWMFLFKVDFTEYVIVRTFGKTGPVLDGSKDAGLHVRWPFVQEVVRYDARTFVFEDAMNELVTRDHQNITLTTYCAWRIKDPLVFQTAVRDIPSGGEEKAGQELIRTKLRSAKGSVIGRRNMADLVNTDPAKMKIPQIEKEIKDAIANEVKRDYGIEITMVGVKTLGLPKTVSDKVIASMKAERQREAQNYQSAGKAEATAISERAKAASEQILAFAKRKAGEIRAEGDAAAAAQYKKFQKNWQLAAYLRMLESLKIELQGRSIIMLDPSTIPALEFFRKGPKLPEAAKGQTGIAPAPKALADKATSPSAKAKPAEKAKVKLAAVPAGPTKSGEAE